MQIEPIKLKIGDDDWEMYFSEHPYPDFKWEVHIYYKSLSYGFKFTDLAHLARDCGKLAKYQLNCFETLPFGQERIHLSPSGQSLAIITPSDAMQNIIIPLPVWFQCELEKRFCEPEKPRMPELEVGDILYLEKPVIGGYTNGMAQYIGGGRVAKRDEIATLNENNIVGIYRLGVKIWEAGE
jgi:hypothetical protein